MWKINAFVLLSAVWGFNLWLLWKAATNQNK